ncbi:hypothetical protein LWI29_013644 [Acer saccharum]|uniref:Uncharacterized protein n=1 Tax=Acer saccharum TaxID=4024 RepID=A0AA39RM21_ACESA|nr:hypothetical protein LWI29_013644 [Acer saccharum]
MDWGEFCAELGRAAGQFGDAGLFLAGAQIAYEYAKRGANLVLVARREHRLRGISENARRTGAGHVIFIAADVVKEDECRRFVSEAVNIFGRGHKFLGKCLSNICALPYLHKSNGRIVVNASVENWLPLPRMSLYAAAKAALINFYETLRFELNDEVGVTIATHGWIGSEMTSGKFMLEEGCRDAMERRTRRFFAPNVLNWTFRLLLSTHGARRTSLIGTGRPVFEATSTGRLVSESTGRPLLEGTSTWQPVAGSYTFSHGPSSKHGEFGTYILLEEVTDTSVFPHLLDKFLGKCYPTYVALPYLHKSNGRIVVNASVENWLPLPRMSLYAAAKAALINFYETLRFELNEVGVTIATHGWIGSEMTSGKFMLEEGAEMQWKEEREVLRFMHGRRSLEREVHPLLDGTTHVERSVREFEEIPRQAMSIEG